MKPEQREQFDITNFINHPDKLNARIDAFKVVLYFAIFGIVWITTTDELLNWIINDYVLYIKLQTYKGWLFVLATAVLIYGLVYRRVSVIKKINDELINSNEQLAGLYEEMVATEEELIEQKDKLKHLAYHDALTDLPNRFKLEQIVGDILSNQQDIAKQFAILLFDIDNFKYINDSLGHRNGDKFLQFFADKLREVVNEPNYVARLSGDEFIVLYQNINNENEIIDLIDRLREVVGEVWIYNEFRFYISLSIGIAMYPRNGETVAELYKSADMAMHQAKQQGKNCHVFFTDKIELNNLKLIDLINQLKKAIENQEFILLYQPQFNLINREIVGVEVLVRWQHPTRGFISPADFIPLAEETGQIYEIEKIVFNEAIKQLIRWDMDGNTDLKMSVNLSSKSLTNQHSFREIEEIIYNNEFDRSRLVVEITETAIISDVKSAIRRLNRLKDLGIKIALDDFGTGYSSLTYLKDLPFDIVKLDSQFIKCIDKNNSNLVIVKSILQLSQELLYEVVAEGIETDEQLDCLMEFGCQSGQGYLFSRPIPANDITAKYLSKQQLIN